MSSRAGADVRPSVAYSLKRCQDFVLTFLLRADLSYERARRIGVPRRGTAFFIAGR
jgi:hypothetical protein